MSKPSYLGANVEVEVDTFASFINKVNLVIDDMAKTVVTVAPVTEANTTNGALSTGNAHIEGVLSATTGAFDEIHGGSMSVPATLILSSNVAPKANTTVVVGNTSARVTGIYSTSVDTTNLTVNLAELSSANVNVLTANTATFADVTISGNVSANAATFSTINSGSVSSNTVNSVEIIVSGNLTVQGVTTLASNTAFAVNTSVITNLTVQETAQLSGTITVGNTTSGTLVINSKLASDLVPDANTRNIGSATNRFATIYANTWNGALEVTGNDISLSGTAPSIFLKDTDAGVADFIVRADSGNLSVILDTNSDGIGDSTIFSLSTATSTGMLFGAKIWTADNDGAGSGLDADLLDGQPGTYYLDAASYSASDVLAKLLTVDGSTSGLDSDLLDGQHGSFYQNASNLNAGTLADARLPSTMSGKTFTSSIVMTGSNNGLELGPPGTTNTPFIDFHSSASSTDYDARIIASGGTGVAGGGTLDFNCATLTKSGQPVWHAGNDGSGSTMDADLLDGQHGSFYQNASNLNAGTIPDARISGAYSGITTLTTSGKITSLGNDFELQGASPTLRLIDTDVSAYDYFVHVNSNNFYVLVDRDGIGGWEGPHPFRLDASTNKGYCFDSEIITNASTGTYNFNTNGRAYPYRVGGVGMNFNWSGQSGQPSWLWGGEDGVNMYVYNPSNFSVAYAANAGALDGLTTPGSVVSSGMASLSVGAIGTYGFFWNEVSEALNPGDTRPGSQLTYAHGNTSAAGTSPAGTWRLMGDSTTGTVAPRISVWMRIS